MPPQEISLVTFDAAPADALRGLRFSNAWAPSPTYADSRACVLTGQYYQRRPRLRITDVFAAAGFAVSEDAPPAGAPDGPSVFRLLEQPPAHLVRELPGVVAVCSLVGKEAPVPMSIFWPGVAESGTSAELVSPMDLAPTLAAIAGLDVRPNARLSFDGLNLVPVLRHGAAGHAALFFDDGVRMQHASLRGGHARPESARGQLEDEWRTWRGFMELGPLQ